MCSLQKKKFLLPSSVINFHWAGQQKTIPLRGICAWPSVGCSTVCLRGGLSTRCAAALIHRPATERTWVFTNNENKYISSFTPRTVFLNKWGEALRRDWGSGILKHRTSLHSLWWLPQKQREVEAWIVTNNSYLFRFLHPQQKDGLHSLVPHLLQSICRQSQQKASRHTPWILQCSPIQWSFATSQGFCLTAPQEFRDLDVH